MSTTNDLASQRLLQRNRELSILNAIAEGLNRALDLDEALDNTLELVADLLGLRTAWLWLLEEDGGDFYLAAARHLPPALADYPERMEDSCLCLDTFEEGDLTGAANVNVLTCSRLKNLVGGTEGLRYHASVPIYTQARPLGVLNVASTNWRSLDEDELQLLYTIGYQLGVAIERARLHTESTRLAASEERNRLAREIHDTLAQGLTAIALQLEAALVNVERDPRKAQERIRRAVELTRANLEEARRSVLDLRAAPLQDHALPEALRLLLREQTQESGARPHFHLEGLAAGLPLRLEAGLYRIAQEALSNLRTHARAHNVWLTLRRVGDHVILAIEDDGVGFDPDDPPGAGHFGLQGMNERVHLLGGEMRLSSSLGAGTKIEVKVPLEHTHTR
ncbi:MAG TPA: GAF domain-containing sensor histidine kinase [Ardenticatenaceae bacterium]|nr:GAF domain-containing sensor histidine kinase [Ardenticatenaceae bacterium]